ncbi:MAG: ankyrin repeat domain-containing protein [Campylobacterota bacterium]
MNIIQAIETNDIQFVRNNIGKFNQNQNGQYDFPLLHRACYLGHLEIIELLIDNGADLEIEDEHKNTPLFSVIDNCQDNWFYVIELLVKKGAKVDGSMLVEAVKQEKYIDVIKLFLDNEADIDYIDECGDKAINYAYDCNYNEAIELLEKYGAVYDGKITNEELILRDYAVGMLESEKLRENRNK